MPITNLLEENCKKWGDDICLVEINPEVKEVRRVTWKEYELMEPSPSPITAGRSHGMYSMKKQIVLPTFFSERGSKKGIK